MARALADALGFVLVDTGAMYRVVALSARRRGVAWSDAEAMGEVAAALVSGRAIAMERGENGALRITLSGEDVSTAIRTPDIGMGASDVSKHLGVRSALLDLQRQLGETGGVVLEGRDIGTVVFPDAEFKFFLTATPEVRARRRYDELVAKGPSAGNAPVTFDDTLRDVMARDAQDMGRAHAPLRQAEDAVLVDSSTMDLAATVRAMVTHVTGRTAP